MCIPNEKSGVFSSPSLSDRNVIPRSEIKTDAAISEKLVFGWVENKNCTMVIERIDSSSINLYDCQKVYNSLQEVIVVWGKCKGIWPYVHP